jgi:F0F1-type ATP synthase assembly protein I
MVFRIGESRGRAIRNIGAMSTVGLSFVLAVVLGALAGLWLDGLLGTSPWLFLLFFFLGVVAGVINVYRMAKKFLEGDRSGGT